MKKTATIIGISILSSVFTLVLFIALKPDSNSTYSTSEQHPPYFQTNYSSALVAGESTDFTTAADKTINTVVHVKNVSVAKSNPLMEFFYGYKYQGEPQVGTGSGVIISQDGYIVTNNHVIDNATELEVTLNNNKTYKATLVGSDPNTDIALIKIEPEEILPYLAFGDSDATKIGEWVLAVGNPFNLTSTVTAGIISAKARDLGKNQSFIQTDAAVNPGNSGGALVNTNGDLIGINTAITSMTGSYIGYSFAVPSNIAKKVVEDIMEFGTVQNGILGISTITSIKVLEEQMGVNDLEGVYVQSIEEGSGAEKSDLKEGDIIKKIDRIKVTKFADLTTYLKAKRPGDVVELEISRAGTIEFIPVTLSERMSINLPILGLTVKNLTRSDQKSYGVKRGVKITDVPRNYQGYGLEGKVITNVDDQEIHDINDAKHIFENLQRYKRIVISMVNTDGEIERLILQ
jgi:Do/DeqQ family serine protease